MSEAHRRPTSSPSPGPVRGTTLPELQYDGPHTPVLIQLPDLSPAKPPSAGVRNQSPPTASKPKRRIHRGHPRPMRPTWNAKVPVYDQAEFRSKLLVGAVLVTILAATYLLLHGRGQHEPTDRWAETPDRHLSAPDAAPDGHRPRLVGQPQAPEGSVDLWPGDDQLLEAPPTNEHYAQPASPAGGGDQQAAETKSARNAELTSGQFFPPANSGQNPPPLAPSHEATESDETPVSWPQSSPTPALPDHTTSSGWPDSSTTNPASTTPRGAVWGGANVGPQHPAPHGAVNTPAFQSNAYQTQVGPSTARLDGKIEIPRPVNSHEQGSAARRY